MKNYRKEMNQIHINEELKNKIKHMPLQKRHIFPFKIIMPLVVCTIIIMIYFLPNKKIEEPKVTSPEITTPEIVEPNELNQPILANAVGDDGERLYAPSKNGQMGGMGIPAKDIKKNLIGYTVETLPVYKYPKRQEDLNTIYSKEVTDKLMIIMKQYGDKLGIKENINNLNYESENIRLSIRENSVFITLRNVDTLIDTKTVDEQI